MKKPEKLHTETYDNEEINLALNKMKKKKKKKKDLFAGLNPKIISKIQSNNIVDLNSEVLSHASSDGIENSGLNISNNTNKQSFKTGVSKQKSVANTNNLSRNNNIKKSKIKRLLNDSKDVVRKQKIQKKSLLSSFLDSL